MLGIRRARGAADAGGYDLIGQDAFMMDLAAGFQVERPEVFVRWGCSATDLQEQFPLGLRHVTTGYLTTECESLGGLKHLLGFHFEPREDGAMHQLEFFRPSDMSIQDSFTEWQSHLEATFGPPSRRAGDEGLPAFTWSIAGAEIRHLVQYRFGPEEHVRITRY